MYQRRSYYLPPNQRSNMPVLLQIKRQEAAERESRNYWLRLLGAVATVGPIVYFTFHWFGR